MRHGAQGCDRPWDAGRDATAAQTARSRAAGGALRASSAYGHVSC